MFSLSKILQNLVLGIGVSACAACVTTEHLYADPSASTLFYTLTGEIALARGEPRVAALQYSTAVADGADLDVVQRATAVADQALQPTLASTNAARWLRLDPLALEARRAAARAALALDRIEQSAAQYRFILANSPKGADAEFEALQADLDADANLFGSRRLADLLAAGYPESAAALRVRGFAAMRADDPQAAVSSFEQALVHMQGNPDGRRELQQALWRAQISAGDVEAPLFASQTALTKDATLENRLDHALLLLAAHRRADALEELEPLTKKSDTAPPALRLMGLIEFQDGNFEAASQRFSALMTSGRYFDDAFYYLGLIAERHDDLEAALRLYAQVRSGENVVSALVRASSILHAHGAAAQADELFDRLQQEEAARAPQIIAARAKMYSDAGDVPQAMETLNAAVQEFPDNIDLRFALAATYEEQGRVPAALRALRAIVRVRPNDPAGWNALGFTLADHGKDLARARQLIERAYAVAPKNSAILDSMGWVLYRQGQPGEALRYLTEAYDDEREGDIAAHLGEVLWQLGERNRAEKIWTEASLVNFNNRSIKSTRQRLQAGQ